MDKHNLKWVYLITLALVWGSSFILMKKALVSFTPVQVGALRMLITAVFLFIVGFNSIKKIQKKHWKHVASTAVLGTFFPAFCFAFAISNIDSSISAILNSLTPFNALVFGALVFGFTFKKNQLFGILIGLTGTVILILKGAALNPNQNYWYAFLVVLASIGYALNANIIKKYLHDLDALAITTGNFLLLVIPVFIVLFFSGFFESFELTNETLTAFGYLIVLAVVGTGIAKVLYNKMVIISSPIFATSVTYLIPIVAVMWGLIDGERLSLVQLLAGGIILFGVWLVNKAR